MKVVRYHNVGAFKGRVANFQNYSNDVGAINPKTIKRDTQKSAKLSLVSRFILRLRIRDRARKEGWHGTQEYFDVLHMLEADDENFASNGYEKLIPILEIVELEFLNEDKQFRS